MDASPSSGAKILIEKSKKEAAYKAIDENLNNV
jgi:hypothetical protein